MEQGLWIGIGFPRADIMVLSHIDDFVIFFCLVRRSRRVNHL